MRSRVILTESIIAITVAVFCTLIAIQTLGYWSASLRIPTAYGGDGTFYGMMIKGVIDSGWYMENPWLGAPFGLDMGAFPMIENTHFAMIKLIGLLTGDFGSALTIFAFASYATAAISAYIVMRLLGLNRMYSVVGAFLFSMQSYHFLRGGHLFLASYFSVPIFVGIALTLYRRPVERMPRWGILVAIAILLFIASESGIYYTFFGGMLIAFSSLAASIEQKNQRPLMLGVVAIVIILFGVMVNLAPHLNSIGQHFEDHTVTDRRPSESEIYGLRLVQMALPSTGHRRSELRNMAQIYKDEAPNVTENATASLGVIAFSGFLVSLLALLVHFKTAPSIELRRLGALNMIAFCYATIGGFGTVFAWLVTAQLRGLNRISIVISFISLCALLFGLQAMTARVNALALRRILIGVTASSLILFGFWDQVPDWKTSNFASANQIRFDSDSMSGKAIEKALPVGSRVYQLPYVSFPETPALFNEGQYGLGRRYLHSHRIAWSYGAMRGREGDQWIREIEALPLAERLSILAASGFDAILVERAAFKDAGEEIEQQISSLIGAPTLSCPDQSCALFKLPKSLDPSAAPLLLAVAGSGFEQLDLGTVGSNAIRSNGNAPARLFLLNPSRRSVKARLRLNATAENVSTIVARIAKAEVLKTKLIAGQPNELDKSIQLEPGITTVLISAVGDRLQSGHAPANAYVLSDVIIGAIDTPEQARAFERLSKRMLDCTGDIAFASTGIFEKSTQGFSGAEPKGRWSDGTSATLICDRVDAQLKVAKIDTSGLVTATHSQRMSVSINGGELYTFDYTFESPARTIVIPLPADDSTVLKFTFSFPDAASPKELGINPDPRKLAVFMYKLWFE